MTADRSTVVTALAAVVILLIAGCGGGRSGSDGDSPVVPPAPTPPAPTMAQRIAAATATAQSTINFCTPIRPFYWEIGDRTASRASGSITSSGNPTVYTADTRMAIASASKWIYGAYVAQLHTGTLTDDDVKFLTFRSGYTSFSGCLNDQSVDQCVAYQNNGV